MAKWLMSSAHPVSKWNHTYSRDFGPLTLLRPSLPVCFVCMHGDLHYHWNLLSYLNSLIWDLSNLKHVSWINKAVSNVDQQQWMTKRLFLNPPHANWICTVALHLCLYSGINISKSWILAHVYSILRWNSSISFSHKHCLFGAKKELEIVLKYLSIFHTFQEIVIPLSGPSYMYNTYSSTVVIQWLVEVKKSLTSLDCSPGTWQMELAWRVCEEIGSTG
jgi:hypothetical protein